MKFLIDKKETDGGRFIADWDLDKRLDFLRAKYGYKETKLKNEYMDDLTTCTIRIKSLKQLKEFMYDMEVDSIIITQDSGYYVSTGDLRIILDIDEYEEEPALSHKGMDEFGHLVADGAGYYDENGRFCFFERYEDY